MTKDELLEIELEWKSVPYPVAVEERVISLAHDMSNFELFDFYKDHPRFATFHHEGMTGNPKTLAIMFAKAPQHINSLVTEIKRLLAELDSIKRLDEIQKMFDDMGLGSEADRERFLKEG